MKYTLHLSNKSTVVIDEEDFEKFQKFSTSGNFIRLKQAIINPSFVIAITPLKEQPSRKIDGYISEETGAFVVTEEKEEIPQLEDEFPSKVRALESGKFS